MSPEEERIQPRMGRIVANSQQRQSAERLRSEGDCVGAVYGMTWSSQYMHVGLELVSIEES